MDIREKVERLSGRMHDRPRYPTQGAVLFVDLERREHRSGYLPREVFRTFLGGRGGNMFLLYNLLPDGRARQFTLDIGPKSIILKPSYGITMRGAGYYEISGLAWSGAGRVAKVEISADGGHSWTEAALTEPVLSKALTRFRLPWRWDGSPAVLLSRTTDERGQSQPMREAWKAQYGPGQGYHYNAVQAWAVAPDGQVANVYV